MSSLNERLESIRHEAERMQAWVIYIYNLVERNFNNYSEIFLIGTKDKDVAKDELYRKVKMTINELIEDYTRCIWMNAYIRKLWDRETAPKFKLGWAKLSCTMNEQECREMSRKEILESKKSNSRSSILQLIMWREALVCVDDSEIDVYLRERAWPHVSKLTQEWKDIIDWFQLAIWRGSLDKLKKQTQESFEKICFWKNFN
jgi:hypothetical protein